METIINPKNYQEQYIENLNHCFSDWGGQNEYHWTFQRKAGNFESDIIIIKDDEGDVIAGSGVTYRKLSTRDHDEIDIGIMTGSWTLPKARGKGCFSEIINISKELCARKAVHFLTAFVMENNPSFRRLKDAGSILIPTSHFISKETIYPSENQVSETKWKPQYQKELYYKFKNNKRHCLAFDYTADEFFKQYIYRIKKTILIQFSSNELAVIEETKDIIKVLFITYEDVNSYISNVKSLANWGLKTRSKRLLLFSTKKEISDALVNLRFQKSPGYFTVLNTQDHPVTRERLFDKININAGDKM